jgi:F-type H+-transporting ATPase subunit epsilon
MQTVTSMHLKVLLPFRIFAEKDGVIRLVAETQAGSFGMLPRRRDCLAALTPGILTYETQAQGEVLVAVDAGVLIKTGRDVIICVRRAIGGESLDDLRAAVEREFLALDAQERSVRAAMTRLEIGFMRRFNALRQS